MQNPRDLLKTQKLLIGGTAILSLIALGCGGAVPGILVGQYAINAVAVSSFLVNVLCGMTANNVGALIDKLFNNNPDILKNQDLGKATGEAIALGIRKVADGNEFPQWRKMLRALADKTVEYWLKIDPKELEKEGLSPLDESQIRYGFSANAGDYDQLRVLDEPQWQIVVRGLMQQHLGADVAQYEPAIQAIARHLNQTFPTNLREVLADDAKGKQAFKKMLLDLERESVGMLRHICDRLDEMPNKTELTNQFAELKTALRQDNQQITRLLK
ncbi:hypothetical protein NG791_22120 [Laspinema sp. D1]|uniref:hypothetical protein n=1 Tax=Laspinema palackyanum TaxID=3231601 RepID=UPI003476413B|nr:hypothetical protein [Laspinema sp. D2b]